MGVHQNKWRSAGADKQSILDFEKNLKDNLYRNWNRMSLVIYQPSAVRQERGIELAEKAATAKIEVSLENSLFKGKVGIYLLSAEALNPLSAKWPIFELPF